MMNSEDARSDFVLAAAAAVLLPFLADLATAIPFYPAGGSFARHLLDVAWSAVHLMLVPLIIVRYREQGLAGFGLSGDRRVIGQAAILALPLVALGILRGYVRRGSVSAIGGQFALALPGSPAVGGGADVGEILARVLGIVVVAIGSVVLIGFLINRAEDAFRQVGIPLVEALRTYGMGAAAVSAVFGLLAIAGRSLSFGLAAGATLALGALVLLADRLVYGNMSTNRSTILAPAIAVLVFHVLATGGVFGGDLVFGLWWGSLGFGLVVVAACLAQTRATALAFVVPLLAAALYPTCISPISVVQGATTFCL